MFNIRVISNGFILSYRTNEGNEEVYVSNATEAEQKMLEVSDSVAQYNIDRVMNTISESE